jgi:hypothetical protein
MTSMVEILQIAAAAKAREAEAATRLPTQAYLPKTKIVATGYTRGSLTSPILYTELRI